METTSLVRRFRHNGQVWYGLFLIKLGFTLQLFMEGAGVESLSCVANLMRGNILVMQYTEL